MKRFIIALLALTALSTGGFAQSVDEIVARMEKEVARGETEGTSLTMTMKIPMIGEFDTHIKAIGDNTRSEAVIKGERIIMWTDKNTSWTYDSNKNEIEIENSKRDSDANKEADMLKGITSGYKASLVGETADSWHIKCVKDKSNTDKNDPKRMNIVVSKKPYLPISVTAKASIATVSLKNFSIGVSPEEVKFDPSAFPGANVVDKR
jgi:outer membrane lipoprotein-sorting protein